MTEDAAPAPAGGHTTPTATAPDVATSGTASGARSVGAGALRVARRLPFTLSVVLLTVVLGLAFGTFWHPADHLSFYRDVAYGLPAFREGRFQTLAIGLWFAVKPWYYITTLGVFGLFAGFAEWRLGTVRTLVLAVIYQFAGVLLGALFLAIFSGTGWRWAVELSHRVDVNFTTGAFAVLAVASATVQPPWRLRLRLGLWAWVLFTVLYVGNLASVQHAAAIVLSLPFSTRLAGPRGLRARAMPTRHEMRLLAAVGLLILAAAQLVALFLPDRLLPFGSTAGSSLVWYGHVAVIVVALLVANGLRHGYRWSWWVVVSLCLVPVLTFVLVVLVLVVGGNDPKAERDLTDALSLLFGGLIVWLAYLIMLLLTRDAFTVPRRGRRRSDTSGSQPEVAMALLRRWGGDTVSWMTTWPENRHMVTADGQSYLAFRPHAGVGIALGDPVGPPGSEAGTIEAFVSLCDRTAMVPYLFSCSARTVAVTDPLGWKSVQVAEDNLVDLPDLAFTGKSWQDVRTALNRARKENITFRMVTLADEPWSLVRQVEQLSEEWLGSKGLPEMGFTLGGVPEALDPAVRVGLAVDAAGMLQGVTSWMPVYAGDDVITGWTLDLMRRRREGSFRPVMEFLIASSCLHFKERGAAFLSLSGAPLARSEDESTGTGPIERFLDTLGETLEPVYGFRSLHAFKAKFKPRHAPMYMVFRDEADLPRIGIGITRAYLPTAGIGELISVVTH